MLKFRTAVRLALCVGLIAAAAIWVALAVGVLGNPATQLVERRITTAKYVSVVAASLVSTQGDDQLQEALENFVSEPELVSIGIRSTRGNSIFAGPHEETWIPPLEGELGEIDEHLNQISADLLANNRVYGTIELVFDGDDQTLWQKAIAFPIPLTAFVACLTTLLSWLVFARTFKYLDPGKVVPDRVRSALDTMAEGLVLLDPDNEIGHANHAFEKIIDCDSGSLLGHGIDEFDWAQSADYGTHAFPWSQALQEQQPVCGVVLELTIADQPTRKFIVNATPIVSENDECRGVLVSFDDVTSMEEKKHELAQMIQTLRQSRDEVERKNKQLEFFASYDQLTECLNRREFFKRIDDCWAEQTNEQMSVVMLDIDHFKGVNDNHGHGTGDEVLRGVGKLLRDCVEERGIVARLGGEEFVALLPDIGAEAAFLIGEELRQSIRGQEIGGLNITVSVGVSGREQKAMDPQHLIDQADQALYAAKNGGRDRVVRFDTADRMAQLAASPEESNMAVELDRQNPESTKAAVDPTRDTASSDDEPLSVVVEQVKSLVELSRSNAGKESLPATTDASASTVETR